MKAMTEGAVAFSGHHTWYQVVGDLAGTDGRLPLLVLHGGPACLMTTSKDLAHTSRCTTGWPRVGGESAFGGGPLSRPTTNEAVLP